KRVTVAGAARSGIAAAELLARRGARVTLSESRTTVPDAEGLTALGVALELGGHQFGTFTNADLVVLSPGVPPEQPAVVAAREPGCRRLGRDQRGRPWRPRSGTSRPGGEAFLCAHDGDPDRDGGRRRLDCRSEAAGGSPAGAAVVHPPAWVASRQRRHGRCNRG